MLKILTLPPMLRRTPPLVINLGRHVLKRSVIAIARLKKFPFFDEEEYLRLHPDIRDYGPARHFIAYGGDEGRKAARTVRIARVLGEASSWPETGQAQSADVPHPSHVGVFHSSLGNVFMRDIAHRLATCLRAAGIRVTEADENSPIGARPRHCIYVAPHEFFLLGRGPDWVRDDVLEQACMYCTEQVQTQWYWRALPFVLMARCAIEMSKAGADALAQVMPARQILPAAGDATDELDGDELDHPLLVSQDWWMRDENLAKGLLPYDSRPLDVSFFGASSPMRERFFARGAPLLSAHESFIYLRKRNAGKVISPEVDGADLTRIASYIASRSRISLNVHRDEFPYFEWHRVVHQAMANGALVMSEPCFADGTFVAGVHYLAEESRYLAEMVDWVLNTPDGQAKSRQVRDNAELAVTESYSPENVGRAILDLLGQDAGR